MAAQGRGGSRTPERVVQYLNEAVTKSSQSAVSRDTGLTQSAIGRYIKGIGEPSHATLVKLADYFEVSVPHLRGDDLLPDRLDDAINTLYDLHAQIKKVITSGNDSKSIRESTEDVLKKMDDFLYDLKKSKYVHISIKKATLLKKGHSDK